jgi:hypothetical protein
LNKPFSAKSYRGTLLLLFFIAWIPRILLAYISHVPLRTPMDEFSTMSTAAHVAGLDWHLITEAGAHYYGGGFTILLWPLFRFISNPFILYGVLLCIAGTLQALIAPIAFHLMYRYLNVRDRRYLFFGALTASFLVATRSTLFYNEHIVILLFWLIIWILCKLVEHQDDSRKQAKWSVILMLTISYSMTIHARTKIYFIVLFLAAVLYFLFCRRRLVSPIPAIFSGIGGYFLAKQFIHWVKVNVWLWQEGDFLKNTDVVMNLSLDLLTSPTAWQGWLATIIGQVHTSLIFTVGFSAIGIPLVVILLYRFFASSPVFQGKPAHREPLLSLENPYLPVIALFCVLAIGGTIFAQSLTWLFRVEASLTNSPYGTNAYGYKAFTYFRYYGVYIGPFFLTALVLLYHAKDLVKRYWGYILVFFVLLQSLFACFVLPHITNNRVASEIYWPFGLWTSYQNTMQPYVYVAGIFVATVFFLIFFFCYLKKKILAPLILLCLVLIYEYCYVSIYQDGNLMYQYNAKSDATYALVREIEKDGHELPHELYTHDINTHTQKKIYTQQFLLKDHKLIPGLPEKDTATAIVFSNKAHAKRLLNWGYASAKLDGDEYLYVKGEDYQKLFEEYGVVFDE